jgi:hypothetical protein
MTTLAVHAAAHSSTDPITVILLGFAAVAVYTISLYLKPLRACTRCGGTGTKLARNGRPTGVTCRRCRGTGTIRRTGATAVHRFYWSVIGEAQRDHRRATTERLRASYQDLIADSRATPGPSQALDDLHSRQHADPPDS